MVNIGGKGGTTLKRELLLRPIGVIRSPFSKPRGTPIQPTFAQHARGEVILDEHYSGALDDIEGFEHVWLLYWFDRCGPWRHKVVPYRDTVERGLFATRAPSRPNPIGLSVVRLVERRKNHLVVEGLDILDGTPLLDIKPYLPQVDAYPDSRAGWFGATSSARELADERFHLPELVRLSPREVVMRLGLRGCLETTARYLHRKLTEELLDADGTVAGAAAALELLSAFLEQTDFRAARAADEELAGRKQALVRIFRGAGGMSWEKL